MTLELAQQIAEREVARRRQHPDLRGYDFSPVRLKSDEELFWTFVSGSAQLVEEGYVPGALYVVIDKRDGHIWDDAEQERYYQSLAARRQPEPQPLHTS